MVERSERTPPHRALRFLIDYRGTRLNLRQRTAIDKATPASDAIRGFEGQSGFWVELRGKGGELLYRRVMDNPIGYDVESYDPERGPRRHHIEKPSGIFSVVVPDLAEAESLVIVSSPLDPAKAAEPAVDLLRISLSNRKPRRAR